MHLRKKTHTHTQTQVQTKEGPSENEFTRNITHFDTKKALEIPEAKKVSYDPFVCSAEAETKSWGDGGGGVMLKIMNEMALVMI